MTTKHPEQSVTVVAPPRALLVRTTVDRRILPEWTEYDGSAHALLDLDPDIVVARDARVDDLLRARRVVLESPTARQIGELPSDLGTEFLAVFGDDDGDTKSAVAALRERQPDALISYFYAADADVATARPAAFEAVALEFFRRGYAMRIPERRTDIHLD